MNGPTLVQLHEGPSLADIPAQLRAMADRIEKGELVADGLFVLIPREQSYPTVFGYGVVGGAYDPIIQFELARQFLVHAAAGLLSD